MQKDIQLYVLNKIERAIHTKDLQDARDSLLASIGSINTVLAGFLETGTYESQYDAKHGTHGGRRKASLPKPSGISPRQHRKGKNN